jgi:hypothetical protein
MPGSDDLVGLSLRIDRLESLEQIRQLPARYALALDMRDLDALAGLFPEDVEVGKSRGREALRAWFDRTLRVQFTGTSHHVGNHVIEFEDADHARGVVYSKNEHETGAEWVIMQMMYVDDTAGAGQDALAGCGALRGRLSPAVPELEGILGSLGAAGRTGRRAGVVRRVHQADAGRRPGAVDQGPLSG